MKEKIDNFYSFIDLSINNILSLYKDPNKNNDDNIKYLENILNEYDPNKINSLNKTFLQKELYNNKLKNKIDSININEFYGLLISFKLSIQCLFSKENSFYSKLMGKNILSEIENSYLPGGNPNINTKIKSYYDIKSDLEFNNNPSNGCYLCSCGYFYTIEPCGLPNQIFKCPNCNNDIGGEGHKLVEREGHIRIYLNEAQKYNVEHRSYYKPFKSMLLKDFKKDVIDKELNKDSKGFNKILEKEFLDNNTGVENIEKITYRFLNFVLFSILYFNNNVNENIFKDKIDDNKSFIDYILIDWNIMTNELKENKNNIDIRIYIQQIIPEFIKLIQEYEDFSTAEKKTEFENKMNDIIINNLKEYSKYSMKYQNENSSLNSITQFETIIRENEILNDEEKFPYYKYFTSQKYPNEVNLKKVLIKYPDDSKYPILKAYLKYKNDERIKKLQNIYLINPFENQLLKEYSFNISRIEAKQKKIKEVIEQKNLKNLFDNFTKGWDNIYKDITQYNCQQFISKEILKSDPLASVLNDDGEIEYGMHIAGAYYYFIEAQNLFIDSVSPYLNKNNILHFFKKQLENTILAQNATEGEVINLNNFKSADFETFDEILYEYSFRNCFKEDNNIDYFNYRKINYNLDLIEEELGRILLVGKRKFSNEQKFIIYEFEAYHGTNSTILNNFIERYPQVTLTKEQKRNLLNNKGNNSKQFLFSLQMLIFHLNKEGYVNEKGNINDIINDNDFPNYNILSDDCKNLFNKFPFGIEHLIEIYNYIELLSYGEVLANVDVKYRDKIEEKQLNNIENYFKDDGEKLIKKNILPTVIRKFISRYLSGIREDQEIKPTEDLFEYLRSRSDLWDINIFNDSRFDEELNKLSSNLIIEVRHSVNFYDILGGDKQIYEEKLEDVIKVDNQPKDKKDNKK